MSEREPRPNRADVERPNEPRRDLYPPDRTDASRRLGRVAVDGAGRGPRAERQSRAAREAGRLATDRAARDDRGTRPPERER